jgi:SIT family siderophore-iron:H+ symporter-like MFS transporter
MCLDQLYLLTLIQSTSFCSVITGILLGLVIVRARRLKPFIVFGTCLFMVSFGIMVRFRGGEESKSGLIGAQVLLGIAGGFFAYPTQASIQAATQHERTSIFILPFW